MSVVLDGVPYLECTDSAYATIPEYAVTGRMKALSEGYLEHCVNNADGEVKLINVATGAFSFEECTYDIHDTTAMAACVAALDTGDVNVMCVGTSWSSFDGIISDFEFNLGQAFLGATCDACSDAYTCTAATCAAGFSDADGNSANGCTGMLRTLLTSGSCVAHVSATICKNAHTHTHTQR
jgi:hypothetical protein